MGRRIGVIAGSGEFPFLLLAEAQKMGYSCVIAGIKEEAETGSAQGVSMVQEASPRPRKGTVAEPEPEIAWALRVLWDYVQHAESERVL